MRTRSRALYAAMRRMPFEILNAYFEPKKFNPSAGETTTLYFELSKDAKLVIIKLKNMETGETLKFKLKNLEHGQNSWTWYGTYNNIPPSEGGEIVPSGKYKAKLLAKSYEGEVVRDKARVRVKY